MLGNECPIILPGRSFLLNYCHGHDVLFRRKKRAHNCKTTNDHSTVFVMRLITLSTTTSAGFPLDAFTANNTEKIQYTRERTNVYSTVFAL